MKVTSVALALLTPLFLFQFGRLLGSDHATVVAAFQNPFFAVVTVLMIGVGFYHLKIGLQVVIEDYVHGAARIPVLIGNTFFCYAAAAAGLFAVAKLALGA
ncbi:MAG: succinate dehydrogenase, hydrophobic membrane anchor protein [Pseudomonadota bacterium]